MAPRKGEVRHELPSTRPTANQTGDLMEPVTHLTAGALGGQALRDRFNGRSLVFLCIVAALIPDLDNFIGLTNPELYLIHHRGITHSLLGGLAIAVLLAAVFRFWFKTIPFWIGAGVAYANIIGHIFLDLITSYGTQIFSPFSHTRYTIECVFIIDPIFTVSLICFLYLSFRFRSRRRLLAVLGLLWLVLYPLINLAIRLGLEHDLKNRLSRQGVVYDQIHLDTEVLTPFFWKVILEKGPYYRMAGVSLLRPQNRLEFKTFAKADLTLMNTLGRRASLFRTYAWFAAYPIMTEEDLPSGARVTFGDLRFYSTLVFVRDRMRNGEMPFSLTAVLDWDRKLTGYEYRRPRGTMFIQHVE